MFEPRSGEEDAAMAQGGPDVFEQHRSFGANPGFFPDVDERFGSPLGPGGEVADASLYEQLAQAFPDGSQAEFDGELDQVGMARREPPAQTDRKRLVAD